MHLRSLFLAAAFAAGAILAAALASSASPSQVGGSKCLRGWSTGEWELPVKPALGHAKCKLYPLGSTTALYELEATLTDVLTPCLSCIEGTVVGTLDDGFGPSPDFTLEGEYNGHWLTGKGTWWAYIYEPGAMTPSGKIAGRFADPFGGVGVYEAEWGICP